MICIVIYYVIFIVIICESSCDLYLYSHICSCCTSIGFMKVGLYSYAVFNRLLTFGGVSVVEAVLFLWGMGLALVEIKQLHSNGFQVRSDIS